MSSSQPLIDYAAQAASGFGSSISFMQSAAQSTQQDVVLGLRLMADTELPPSPDEDVVEGEPRRWQVTCDADAAVPVKRRHVIRHEDLSRIAMRIAFIDPVGADHKRTAWSQRW
jgi:hypothetical protein